MIDIIITMINDKPDYYSVLLIFDDILMITCAMQWWWYWCSDDISNQYWYSIDYSIYIDICSNITIIVILFNINTMIISNEKYINILLVT